MLKTIQQDINDLVKTKRFTINQLMNDVEVVDRKLIRQYSNACDPSGLWCAHSGIVTFKDQNGDFWQYKIYYDEYNFWRTYSGKTLTKRHSFSPIENPDNRLNQQSIDCWGVQAVQTTVTQYEL